MSQVAAVRTGDPFGMSQMEHGSTNAQKRVGKEPFTSSKSRREGRPTSQLICYGGFTMKKRFASFFLAAGLVALLLMLLVTRKGQAQSTEGEVEFFRTKRITITHDQVRPGTSEIRAFVPTGSLNVNCLATLGETTFVQTSMSMFCAPRVLPDQRQGVMVSVFYNFPPPDDLVLFVTLYQKGAKRYGTPVLCPLISDGGTC